jgi:hypothetical protein
VPSSRDPYAHPRCTSMRGILVIACLLVACRQPASVAPPATDPLKSLRAEFLPDSASTCVNIVQADRSLQHECFVSENTGPNSQLIGRFLRDASGQTIYFHRYWRYTRRQVDSAFMGWAGVFLGRFGRASYCPGRLVLFWRGRDWNAILEVQNGSDDFDSVSIVAINVALPTGHISGCPKW